MPSFKRHYTSSLAPVLPNAFEDGIPTHAGIRAGNEQELQEAVTVAERKIARLAEWRVIGALEAQKSFSAEQEIAARK